MELQSCCGPEASGVGNRSDSVCLEESRADWSCGMDAIRYLIDTMVAVSFTIEKFLWVIERYLQINLSHFTKE